ncbi:unnamed protein product [Closterium sp. Yama58-4]|nr:unnamed protein product [Closterium sp. Yama58-4]
MGIVSFPASIHSSSVTEKSSEPSHDFRTLVVRSSQCSMAKGGQQPCVVCQSQAAKYKCPTCLSPYCSVACCRTHKETPCQPREQPATSAAEAGGTTAATTADAQGSAGPDSSRGKQPVRPFEECEDEDELSWRLPCSTLREIADDAALRQQLRDHELQRMLLLIDSSPHPEAALEAARSHPAFANFTAAAAGPEVVVLVGDVVVVVVDVDSFTGVVVPVVLLVSAIVVAQDTFTVVPVLLVLTRSSAVSGFAIFTGVVVAVLLVSASEVTVDCDSFVGKDGICGLYVIAAFTGVVVVTVLLVSRSVAIFTGVVVAVLLVSASEVTVDCDSFVGKDGICGLYVIAAFTGVVVVTVLLVSRSVAIFTGVAVAVLLVSASEVTVDCDSFVGKDGICGLYVIAAFTDVVLVVLLGEASGLVVTAIFWGDVILYGLTNTAIPKVVDIFTGVVVVVVLLVSRSVVVVLLVDANFTGVVLVVVWVGDAIKVVVVVVLVGDIRGEVLVVVLVGDNSFTDADNFTGVVVVSVLLVSRSAAAFTAVVVVVGDAIKVLLGDAVGEVMVVLVGDNSFTDADNFTAVGSVGDTVFANFTAVGVVTADFSRWFVVPPSEDRVYRMRREATNPLDAAAHRTTEVIRPSGLL